MLSKILLVLLKSIFQMLAYNTNGFRGANGKLFFWLINSILEKVASKVCFR